MNKYLVMKIWYGSILVATAILTGYLVLFVKQAIPELNAGLGESQALIKTLQEQVVKQNELLLALQADLKKQAASNAAPPKPPQEDKGKLAVDSLRDSLTKFAAAEAKKQQGDFNSAIDLLKSTKQVLWKAGDVLNTHQAALRALMGPIDIIMTQWKKGDKAADTSKVSTAVKTVLQKIDSKFDN